MRTADAIRLVEVIRSECEIYPVPRAYDALFKLEVWIREGAVLEDVRGIDPRINREIHRGTEKSLAEGTGTAGSPDAAGGGGGAVLDRDELARLDRIGRGYSR